MWTVIRFVLHGEDERRYRTAAELLRDAGFVDHRVPGPGRAAAADVLADPAVLSREIFVALGEAGLRPLWVSGAHVDVRPRHARRPPTSPPS
jgi:hypothetical protein